MNVRQVGGLQDEQVRRWLGALWGKSASKGGGRRNVLLSHLLDTAAVAEWMWDRYLAQGTRRMLEETAGGPGRGKRLFAWLCGIHDCGKATPAFQWMDEECATIVRAAGLRWDKFVVESRRSRRRHDIAGGMLLTSVLRDVGGWAPEHIDWVWPLVAGHHGAFPSEGHLKESPRTRGQLQGKGPEWEATQRALVRAFTEAVGFGSLCDAQPVSVPSRADQLGLSGFIVMADWIASDQEHFRGIDDIANVSMAGARERAAAAWKKLDLHGGWRNSLALPGAEAFQDRFGHGARPAQRLVADVVRCMTEPGLVIVEAPTGEGKTKAALMAAETLASRFGANGLFLGMPTQATCDPMFDQMRKWLGEAWPGMESEVALLHGKRRFNATWRRLRENAEAGDDGDPYGMAEEDACYGVGVAVDCGESERRAPAEWFLGPKRGLLTPFVVGTIDQLLFAATRTKHVMLRTAGLLGKVVVLDEVHAADVYMSQFLKEGLWWLARAGVPVVLLSATLPPDQRRELVSAYLSGAAGSDSFDPAELPPPGGYPSVTAAWLDGAGSPHYVVENAPQWRDDLRVRVRVIDPEPAAAGEPSWPEDDGEQTAVGNLLAERLAEGGCALVIRNTVPRAQRTYEALRERFAAEGVDVRLLHGRLHAADRAERTASALSLLGPPGPERVPRERRLILVATQVAEQSFDVDADILVTDLAPIDLLLQRVGRLHRHDNPDRPGPLRDPEVVVTGLTRRRGRSPRFEPGSKTIYGAYLLLRTAAQILAVEGGSWAVPGDVPGLVARVYGGDPDEVPAAWAADERAAFAQWAERQQGRADSAAEYLLTGHGEHTRPTLAGLHYGGTRGKLEDERFQALVRDGDPSVEAILVCRDDRGFRTLAGRRLSVNGEVAPELLDEVLGATVRLPAKLTESAERELGSLPGWRDDPWLRYARALVLDADGARLGEHLLRYDAELGLVVEADGV